MNFAKREYVSYTITEVIQFVFLMLYFIQGVVSAKEGHPNISFALHDMKNVCGTI